MDKDRYLLPNSSSAVRHHQYSELFFLRFIFDPFQPSFTILSLSPFHCLQLFFVMRCTRALRLTSRLSTHPFVHSPSFAASLPRRITSPRAATQLPTPQPFQRPSLRCFSVSTLAHQQNPSGENRWTPFTGPPDNAKENHWENPQGVRRDEPHYQMTFTCKPCRHRSAHRVSKHGYHSGTVLIQCPNCKVRHLISDHLQVSGRLLLGGRLRKEHLCI